jgi:hypothetical protein
MKLMQRVTSQTKSAKPVASNRFDRMTNPLRHTGGLLLCLVVIVTVGCQENVALGLVEGTVTQDGEPLDEIQVRFLPDPDSNSASSMGWAVTDAQGHYSLEYADDQPGAPIGANRVTLADLKPDNSRQGRPPASRLDERFKNAFQTPLKYEVVEGEQTFDIEVSDY